MALTKDIAPKYQDGLYEAYPIAASETIYQGAAVGENASGYARSLQAGDKFLGFADEHQDNSAGAAGALTIKVRKRGNVQLAVTSLAITDNDGVAVYASDDATFTKVSTDNSLIGTVSRFISAGVGIVAFDADALSRNAIA